jgi:hypothetical protein
MEGGPAGFPKFNAYVFSTTPDKVKDGATRIKGDTKTAVEKSKRKRYLAFWQCWIDCFSAEFGIG